MNKHKSIPIPLHKTIFKELYKEKPMKQNLRITFAELTYSDKYYKENK